MIYFTRHGRVSDGRVSEIGFEELGVVKKKLNRLGFCPQTIFSSKILRAIQTACYLGDVPESKCTYLPELGLFGNLGKCKEIADTIINLIQSFEKHGGVLVACHDSMAAVLAMRLSEKRGGTVDWDNVPGELMYLRQGHGLILCGSQYAMVCPE